MRIGSTILLALSCLICAAEPVAEKWSGQALKLDGILNESAWKSGNVYSDFTPFASEVRKFPEVETCFRLRYDQDFIYVGIECEEPLMDKVRAQRKAIWYADGMELFFSPSGKDNSYYQFRLNADGNRFQQYYSEGGVTTPVFYAPQWDFAVNLQEKSWSAEVRIPLTAFYMTDSRAWSSRWRLNVVRSRRVARQNISWSKLRNKCNVPSLFRYMGNFPFKDNSMDNSFSSSTAVIKNSKDKKFYGDLNASADIAKAGRYTVKCTVGNREYCRDISLKAGENIIKIADTTFDSLGKNRVRLQLIAKNKVLADQAFDVNVQFEPLTAKLTTPAYRNTFYPKQDSQKITGYLQVNVPGKMVEIALDNRPKTTCKVPDNGLVAFTVDSANLSDGKHALKFKLLPQGIEKTVTVSKYSKVPEGINAAWVENSQIIWNGQKKLPRFLYAHYYLGGQAMREKTDADDLGITGPESDYRLVCTPSRLVKGIEEKEGTKDIVPSPVLFKKLQERIKKHGGKNFLFYYLSDEPECRAQSPVYIRHLYEFIKENDPWHPVMICTRAPAKYLDCADIISTHPYTGPSFDANGKRYLELPLYRTRNYVRQVTQSGRPDKVSSYTGQFFTYKNNSIFADYPAFEELEAQVWSSLANGSRWYCNYAYHDLGDRPVLYEGTRYLMTSLRALEGFIVNAETVPVQMQAQFNNADAVLLQDQSARVLIVVNLLDKPQQVSVSAKELKTTPLWHVFRQNKTLAGNQKSFNFKLAPYECMILTSKTFDQGLPLRSDAVELIKKLEKERLSRPNLLLGRGLEIDLNTSNTPRSTLGMQNKLFDGTYDVQAWQHTKTGDPRFIEMSFPAFVPEFNRVRIWGYPVDKNIKISIRKAGEWRTPQPEKISTGKWFVEFDYGKKLRTIRMRIEFPKGKKPQEVYEIEFLK